MDGKDSNVDTSWCIIVAAGRGARMGGTTPKPLLPWGHSTMCGTVVEAALAAALRVIVVTGYNHAAFVEAFGRQTDVDSEVLLVHNPGWERGMTGSISCGLAEARRLWQTSVVGKEFPGAVVALADMPAVPSEAFAAVAGGGRALAATATAPVVFAEKDGKLGHPVFIPGRLVDVLSGLEPDGRLRTFLMTQPWMSVSVDNDGIFTDFDTPEAYLDNLRQ